MERLIKNRQTPGWGLRIFLLLELLLFGSVYIWGSRGLQSIYRMTQYNLGLRQEIQQLQYEIKALEQQQANWQIDDFYKEQLAREQLQLARPQEAVYYLV